MGSEMCIRDRCWVCLDSVAFYGRRGDKPVIKPLVADLEWLAQQRRPVSPEATHTAPTRHGRKEAA